MEVFKMSKKRLILTKETAKMQKSIIAKENPGVEIFEEESCDVKYDTSELKIFSIDGALVHLDTQEGRLLCFVCYPDVESNGSEKGKPDIYNKCLCEIRCTAATLRYIANSLVEEIEDIDKFERKKEPLIEALKKENTTQHGMYV